ncbi:carboxypeptidase M32 [Acidiphilium sp. AL]|uniref:Metal-dependent carboxypeptidase n=1 Tax=Acidiphilium iwatense TaxID=768198 RepID=A0ABS9E0I5_9PROT|nr:MULTISPECIES: carboxypeptidase M32 [Acidiphilium]MCF3947426.1 carboxypeptidase M32 [Acidiphilium iwatense]MCU4160665.1 carboxypeptidase M32 [Acidiphilium sp. AL]
MTDAYDRLTRRFARMATVEEAVAMLGWDEAAVMPDGGAEARADQLATLSGIAHGMLVEPEVAADLAVAEAAPPADDAARRNLALMRRAHRQATAVPGELVEALARQSSTCEKIWRAARKAGDFAMVAGPLGELLALVRVQASALGAAFGLAPYDALIDQHQQGVLAGEIAPVFARYEAFLREALPRAEALQAKRDAALPGAAPFAESVQEALCRRLAAEAGLDFAQARLDRSTHPFCGGTPSDIRITTRYDEADFCSALMGVLHETGHALYEAGLPRGFARQPVGFAAGMAAHESQSLIVEMQAARSDAYLGFLGPMLAEAFGQDAADFSLPRLSARLRHVTRSCIRVEADELTYPAHVILRFRLEAAMIAGDLAVADLPEAWNQGMRDLLGITPPDDARGCLQDIHWYCGTFGYFPSYTLGAMAAAQLMAAARRAVPDLDLALARGDFSPLLGWLRANVHAHGARFGFNELLRQATGKMLDPADFEAHLAARYLVG